MGHCTEDRATQLQDRQQARCLFLLLVFLSFFFIHVNTAAAQTGAPSPSQPLVPVETWVMIGVVLAGLTALAIKLFFSRKTV